MVYFHQHFAQKVMRPQQTRSLPSEQSARETAFGQVKVVKTIGGVISPIAKLDGIDVDGHYDSPGQLFDVIDPSADPTSNRPAKVPATAGPVDNVVRPVEIVDVLIRSSASLARLGCSLRVLLVLFLAGASAF
jgi:hypothetical protein